jgi:hypothetical protein
MAAMFPLDLPRARRGAIGRAQHNRPTAFEGVSR